MSEPKLKIDASEFIEHTCQFADDIMQRQLGEKYSESIYKDEHNCINYTEEGQDIFNELLDEVEWFLGLFGVVNGSAYEEMSDERITGHDIIQTLTYIVRECSDIEEVQNE